MKKTVAVPPSDRGQGISPSPAPGGRLAPRLSAIANHPSTLPVLAALAVFIGLFWNLNGAPLFDVDEGAFSEATREMLERGDYVTTYLNGKLRFDKPILIYWLQALSVSLFGVNEIAFRLPSTLAALGWVGAVLAFTASRTDRVTGYAAALFAATATGVCVIGRAATADALLNMLLALTMFDVCRFMMEPLARYRYRAYLWMGLGVLTKGPVAIVIPLAVSAIVFLLHGKWRLWLKAVADPLGWLIILAIAGPWYALEYHRQGQAFIDGFFMRHNVERFMSPLQGHRGNPLYYPAAALLLLLPHSGFFIRILPGARRLLASPLETFLWTWFLFVLIFFSFGSTKLPHYLLYGITPLFVLMAIHRESLRSRWLAFAPAFFLLGLAAALPLALRLAVPHIGNSYVREMLSRTEVFGAGYYLLSGALLIAMVALAAVPRVELWKKLLAAGVLCAISLVTLVLPSLGELQQGPVKEAAEAARKLGVPVKAWAINAPSFSVYRREVTPWIQAPAPGDVILTRSDRLPELGRVEILYRKGGIVLAKLLS